MIRRSQIIRKALRALWRLKPRRLDWWLLWLTHSKFNVGVSGVIINPGGKLLVLRHVYRRSHEWGLPSGWANKGETLEAALTREILEEVSLEINVDGVIMIKSGFRLRVEVILSGKTAALEAFPQSLEILEATFIDPVEASSLLSPEQASYVREYFRRK